MASLGSGDHIPCALPIEELQLSTQKIREAFPNVKLTYIQTSRSFDLEQVRSGLAEDIFQDVTILCTFSALPRSREDAPKLRWLQLLVAGSNHVEALWLYKDRDITIATASGIHAPQIAEWAVMTALIHWRRYNTLYELQKDSQWGIRSTDWREVPTQVGRRLGVIGYGSIGRQIARVGHAMGMEVYAYTASARDTPEKRKNSEFLIPGTGDPDGIIPSAWFNGFEKENLHHFLKQDLDWIVISVPLTPQTKGLLSAPEFAKLRQGGRNPFISNVARGANIDQEALIAALKDGTLGGAALGVTDPEPLPEDSELWKLENVILTPHISANGSYYFTRAFEVLEANLKLAEEGKKRLNVVNRDRGY